MDPVPRPPRPKLKTVEVTHTRTHVLNRKVLLAGASGEMAARHDVVYDQMYLSINREVHAVSMAVRNGARFFDFWLRSLLQRETSIPDDFPWNRAVTQAFAAMKATCCPKKKSPGYDEALRAWRTLLPDLKRPDLQSNNTLTAESEAYYNTLLSNYTTQALPTHVARALRFLYPEYYRVFGAMLIGRVDIEEAIIAALPEGAKTIIQRCWTIANADFTDSTLLAATKLRWELLRAIEKRVAEGPKYFWRNKQGELVESMPKWFTLVPHAQKAARFIRIDNNVARRLMGFRETVPAKYVPDDRERALTGVSALFTLFGDNAWIRKCTKSVRRDGGAVLHFPKSVCTDGVDLHVSFIEKRRVPETVAAAIVQQSLARYKDYKSRDGEELRRQLSEPENMHKKRHGTFALEAADGLDPTTHCTASVGVDPGVKYLLYTSENRSLSRRQYSGHRTHITRYDLRKKTPDHPQHPHYVRRNMVPNHIGAREDELSLASLCAPSTFEANLMVWATHAEALQEYYGSRTWRSCQLRSAARKRRALAEVVELVAPDPRTVIVFGANYNGRRCRRGDVAGPVCVKALRRKLAQHRVMVMVDEYNTTKMHAVCGQELIPDPSDPSKHERMCMHCGGIQVKRDLNAAININSVWTQYLRDGTRPPHLCIPSQTERFSVPGRSAQ